MESVFGYEYTTRTHLLVTDEDAADFLQSQFTNELRPIERGRCTYGLWLDVKGKVLADSFVLCEGESQFRLVSEFSEASVLLDTLERHIIADDVVLEPQEGVVAFALIGEGADVVLSDLGLAVPTAGRFVASEGLVAFRGRRSKLPSYELVCLSADAAARVRVDLLRFDVKVVDYQYLELIRIDAGYPLVPVEVGAQDLAGEGGLEADAVSFTKGCYLGQEVVARMHNVGRPQRTLFVVAGLGEVPHCPLTLYNEEMKSVGELRTAVANDSNWRGVAMLKHRFAGVGDTLNSDVGRLRVERVLRPQKGDVV